MRPLARAAFLPLLLGVSCATAGNSGSVAEASFALADLNGQVHNPMAPAGAASVMIFITVDCPISSTYSPEIQAILRDYADQPIEFYLVHVDPDVSIAAAAAHAEAFSLSTAILMDPEHRLVETVGVTVTPEAAVILPDGSLAYRGRIDNWYGDLGAKRPRPTRHELRDAIDAVLQGVPVRETRTEAIGCYIPEIF